MCFPIWSEMTFLEFAQSEMLWIWASSAPFIYDQNNIETAIRRQQTATYGDLRSPTRAAFQNVPNALKMKINYYFQIFTGFSLFIRENLLE